MKVALLQLAYDDAEPMAERVERGAAMVREQRGADLVVLPELWGPTGFTYQKWAAAAQPLDGEFVATLAQAAREAHVTLHAGSFVEYADVPGPDGRHLYNTSVLLDRFGAVTATYRKIHRFGFSAGEPTLLEAGTTSVVADIPRSMRDRSLRTVRVGLSTCYDLRFPELFRTQVDQGAEVLLMCSCWPAARVEHWRVLLRARAIENQCLMIACNTAGTHGGAAMAGHSAVIAPDGTVLGEAGTDHEVLVVDVDLASVPTYRHDFPVLADRRTFSS